jgi:hypothetical protein
LTEEPERPPAGEEDSRSVDLGEPEREAEGEDREERRPDLDERHDRIRTTRKAPGPPLAEPDEAEPLEDEPEGGGAAEEQPVDPEE